MMRNLLIIFCIVSVSLLVLGCDTEKRSKLHAVMVARHNHTETNIAILKRSNSCVWCNLRAADLKGANLHSANLRLTQLYQSDLSKANLTLANLSESNLSGANLSGANLTHANLIGANLNYANLMGANLKGARLQGADFSLANLQGTYLEGLSRSKLNKLLSKKKTVTAKKSCGFDSRCPHARPGARPDWDYQRNLLQLKQNQSSKVSPSVTVTKTPELPKVKPAPNITLSLDTAKAQCLDLGFKKGTEKFGDCVLKLSK